MGERVRSGRWFWGAAALGVLAVVATGCSNANNYVPVADRHLPNHMASYQQAVETQYRSLIASLNQTIRSQEAIVATDPNYADGYVRLAGLFLHAGEPNAAISALRRATQAAPGRAKYWVLLGQALGNTGQSVSSETAYKQALRINPGDWIAWDGLGFAAVSTNHLKTAWTDVQRALAVGGNDGPTWDLAGRTLLAEGDTSGALADFQRSQQVESNWWQPYYDAARADLTLGNTRGAVRSLARAKSLDPTNGLVWELNQEITSAQGRTHGTSYRGSGAS